MGVQRRKTRRDNPWRASQQAKSPRARNQNFFCVDRQQRHRTAEQYREEIQRDRAENQFVIPDVAESREYGSKGKWFARAGRRLHFYTQRRQHRNSARRKCCGVNRRRAAEKSVKNSPHGWPKDRRKL